MTEITGYVEAGIAVLVFVGSIAGSAAWLAWWLGERLDRITQNTTLSLIALESKFQSRHEENIDRFARLETAIKNNGHGRNPRAKK